MTGNLPVPPGPGLARAAMERVLARAAELQAGTDGDAAEEGGGMTEAQLIELANEVGLSKDHVRQALAEERARLNLTPERGAVYSMLGSATVQTARTVPGDVPTVLAALDTWMQKTESLQVKRRFGDQLAWEPRQDFLSAIRRSLKVGGRAFHLAVATDVTGVVASVEGQRSHVRLVANFEAARGQRAGAALVAVVTGLLIGIPSFWLATEANLPLAAALALVPALALPAAAIAFARRQFRELMNRAQVSLEQALDRIEHGDGPRRAR